MESLLREKINSSVYKIKKFNEMQEEVLDGSLGASVYLTNIYKTMPVQLNSKDKKALMGALTSIKVQNQNSENLMEELKETIKNEEKEYSNMVNIPVSNDPLSQGSFNVYKSSMDSLLGNSDKKLSYLNEILINNQKTIEMIEKKIYVDVNTENLTEKVLNIISENACFINKTVDSCVNRKLDDDVIPMMNTYKNDFDKIISKSRSTMVNDMNNKYAQNDDVNNLLNRISTLESELNNLKSQVNIGLKNIKMNLNDDLVDFKSIVSEKVNKVNNILNTKLMTKYNSFNY